MSHFLTFTASVSPYGKGRPRFSMGSGFPRAYTPEKTRHFEMRFSDCAHGAMMRAGLIPTYDAIRLRHGRVVQVPNQAPMVLEVDVRGIPGRQGEKGEALRYEDLTVEQKEEWKRDAKTEF